MATEGMVERAQGCLLGQLAGDALGGLVEFKNPGEIRRAYPNGVRELADGGTWNTLAGQPTDDSEMALLLARMLVKQGAYDPAAAHRAYLYWMDTGPFDCGNTIASALRGRPNAESQANGSMMRISPLGIFGARRTPAEVAAWARQDAALTHPHPVCQEATALYAMAVAQAIRSGDSPKVLHGQVLEWAREQRVTPALLDTLHAAATAPPSDYVRNMGWVLTALHNALWQLLHAPTLEEGVVDTILRGGDTDTNAAICGALLGAVHGRGALPGQWVDKLLHCRPIEGNPGVYRPRPACFWPVDALELAEALVQA